MALSEVIVSAPRSAALRPAALTGVWTDSVTTPAIAAAGPSPSAIAALAATAPSPKAAAPDAAAGLRAAAVAAAPRSQSAAAALGGLHQTPRRRHSIRRDFALLELCKLTQVKCGSSVLAFSRLGCARAQYTM